MTDPAKMFPYTHIVKRNIKHTYLRFDNNGRLIVTSPPCSTEKIETILLKKSRWIANAQAKISKQIELENRIPTTLQFLGDNFPLDIDTNTTKNFLSFNQHSGFLMGKEYNPLLIDKFYLDKAKEILPMSVANWAKQMNLYPNRINFRKTKRQWGSCSKDNNISLSTTLMKLPMHLIDYVIVHELAHIQHKHHQKSFWDLVSKYIPQYKDYRYQFRDYT